MENPLQPGGFWSTVVSRLLFAWLVKLWFSLPISTAISSSNTKDSKLMLICKLSTKLLLQRVFVKTGPLFLLLHLSNSKASLLSLATTALFALLFILASKVSKGMLGNLIQLLFTPMAATRPVISNSWASTHRLSHGSLSINILLLPSLPSPSISQICVKTLTCLLLSLLVRLINGRLIPGRPQLAGRNGLLLKILLFSLSWFNTLSLAVI